MRKIFKIILPILIIFLLNINKTFCDNNYARSVFIPRQLSYNPILENAQTFATKRAWCNKQEDNFSDTVSKINNQKQALEEKNNIKKDNLALRERDHINIENIDIDQCVAVKNVKVSQEQKDKEFKQAEYLLSKIIDPFSLNEQKVDSKLNLKQPKVITSPKDYINKKIIEARSRGKLIEKKKKIVESVQKIITQEVPAQEVATEKQAQEDITQEKPSQEVTTQEKPAQKIMVQEKSEQEVTTREKPSQEITTHEKPAQDITTQEKQAQELIAQKPAQEVIQENNLKVNKPAKVLKTESTPSKNFVSKKWGYVFSIKPIYTQNVGSKFKQYFNIFHKCTLNAQQNGSGDIDPLWFNVKGSDNNFYSSNLSFCPKRQTYGSMIYFSAALPHNLEISVNTAIVQTRNNINICERDIQNLCSTCTSGFGTVTQSFASSSRLFDKICGTQTKTGLDDIQVKFAYTPEPIKICNTGHSCKKESENLTSKYFIWDVYGLLGIPTGSGSKAEYLFEPLVGSKHAQIGFGANIQCDIARSNYTLWSVLGEFKYRYAFAAQERRAFDLRFNGQWSRYLLFVNASDKYATYPAINDLTFNAKVKPRNSLDLYIATHIDHNAWNFEFGYDLWYRSPEKIELCRKNFPAIGIADLKGIAGHNPQSAHATNISQGIAPGANQMISDKAFTPITLCDISCISGAMESSLSNSFYGSVGYTFETKSNNKILLGLNASYELGSYIDTPDNATTWLNCDFYF